MTSRTSNRPIEGHSNGDNFKQGEDPTFRE